jgi:DNA-binding transcriptional LysR family regulator
MISRRRADRREVCVLNPRHLKTLGEVLATGSFAGAAARLGYTASAVAQQMAALERASGLTLFERNGRTVLPTRAAEEISGHAQSVIRALEALERDVGALGRAEQGVVRVGAFPTATASILPEALARLHRERPGIRVQLEEGEPDEIVPAIDAGGLDLAVVFEYERAPRRWSRDLAVTPLIKEGLFLLVPPAWGKGSASAQRISFDDLRDVTWISTREGTGGERSLLQLCATAGFLPRIEYRSNDFGLIRGLVRVGLGFAIVPALALVDDQSVRALPLPDDGPKRRVLALSRAERPSGLVDAVLRALVEAIPTVARRAQRGAPATGSPDGEHEIACL